MLLYFIAQSDEPVELIEATQARFIALLHLKMTLQACFLPSLLRRIFLYDPKARITAKEALKHPWFRETIMDDGAEAARIRVERTRAEAAAAYAQ